MRYRRMKMVINTVEQPLSTVNNHRILWYVGVKCNYTLR
jgi:hypothetical protein